MLPAPTSHTGCTSHNTSHSSHMRSHSASPTDCDAIARSNHSHVAPARISYLSLSAPVSLPSCRSVHTHASSRQLPNPLLYIHHQSADPCHTHRLALHPPTSPTRQRHVSRPRPRLRCHRQLRSPTLLLFFVPHSSSAARTACATPPGNTGAVTDSSQQTQSWSECRQARALL